MKQTLQVLLVEDSEDDAKLALHELAKGGWAVTHTRIQTAEELRAALGQQTWDIVLCDYALPHFSGETALQILKEAGRDIPFIFVSGTMGEDVAVASMRAGAHDYVMKGNLARLVPAIHRELRDAADRRQHREAERQMRMSEHKYRHLFRTMSDATLLIAEETNRIIDANEQAELLFGRSRDEFLGLASAQLYPHRAGELQGPPVESARHAPGGCESVVQRKNGTTVPVHVTVTRIQLYERQFLLTLFRDISERKQAESALKNVLRQAHTMFMRFVIEAPPGWEKEGVEWAAANFRWAPLQFDEAAAQAVLPLDLPPGQGYYAGWVRAKHPDDEKPMGLIAHRALLSNAPSWHQEFRCTDRHGHLHWFAQVASVEPASHGRWHVMTVNTDITERKLAENALHAREEEFRALAENAPDAICRFDRECRLTYTNPAYLQLLSLPANQLLGRTPVEVYPQQSGIEVYQQKIQQVIESATPLEYETTLGALSAPYRPSYNIRLVPEHDRGGQVVSVLCVGRDISALKETERQLRTLIENSPDIILRFDRAGRYLFVNHAMEKVTGIPAAEYLGRVIGDVASIHRGPAVAEKMRLLGQFVERVFVDGEAIEEELRLPLPTGELIFNVRLIPEVNEVGQVASVLTLAREVTARQRAEEALQSSEQRFRQVTENIDEVFWLTDPGKDEMIYISPAYERLWGRTCDSLYAKPQSWLEAIHSEDRPRVRSAAISLQATGGYNLEYRIVRPDGVIRWIRDRAFPIQDERGHVYRIAGVAEDITEKRQLEEQLRQAQKMDSLGTLAGGIAHDFNNILTGVLGSAEVARLELPPDHPVLPWIRNITQAGNRARELVLQILTFGRKHDSEMTPHKLQLVITEALDLLRSTIPSMVQIESKIDPTCPPVFADDTQIHQVVMNLCTNAWHALPEHGGRIEVSLTTTQVTPDMAATRLGLAAGPYVLLAVQDNGRGMTPDVVSRIFEPFFTTKKKGRGTGLGLAVVHGIVQSHQGAIFAQSTPGQGTLFEVFLPVLTQPTIQYQQVEDSPLVAGHSESILLIDDDATSLAGLRGQLEHLGYRVTALSDSRTALELFLAQPESFDLILTDYAMPDISGHELAAKVLSTRPGFPVILASGYIDSKQIQRARTLGVREFVRKPISSLDLSRSLARHLGSD